MERFPRHAADSFRRCRCRCRQGTWTWTLLLCLAACSVRRSPEPAPPWSAPPDSARPDRDPGGGEDSDGLARAEVKVTVRADQIDLVTRLLQLSKPEAERRAITFYDTPALELYSDGLILRSRKLQDGSDDSTVKLRGLDAGRIDAGWLQQRGCRCEEDWVGDAAVPACSYSAKQRKGEIDEVAAGRRGVHKLYSAEQERFAAAYAPRALDFTRLRAFGPVQAFIWKRDVAELGDRLGIERWELPDGTALLELSVRVPRTDAAAARSRLLGFLQARGLDTSSPQETKTRVVLEYFSSR